MSISCGYEWGSLDWYYEISDEYAPLYWHRRQRCCGCHDLIEIGDICVEVVRYRDTITDIEERIYGAHKQLGSKYLCEKCADLHFSLTEAGYSITIEKGKTLKESWNEYKQEAL